MNKKKKILAILGVFVTLTTNLFLQPSKIQAVACPYIDGGYGDSDSTSGVITLNTNYTITADTNNLGVFNCSNVELVVANGATLTLTPYNNGDSDYGNDFGVTLQVNKLTIQSGGSVTADALGYPKLAGPGAGGNYTSSYNGGGGGHGGVGGTAPGAVGGIIYGSLTQPVSFGSGGGRGQDASPYQAGAGGGAIKIVANSDVTIDGTLSAKGGNHVSWGGAGSGGSIWITSGGSVGGNGTVTVQGGLVSGTNDSGSGAGGRIAIESTSFNPSLTVTAAAGTNVNRPLRTGQNGTAIIVDSDSHTLYIRNSQRWIPDTTTYFEDMFSTITDMRIENNATLELDSGNKNVSDSSGYGWDISLDSLVIDAASTVSGLGLGHPGELGAVSAKGPGFPGPRTRYDGGGGGHGGKGGDARGASSPVAGGIAYGSSLLPITLGSGGGKGQSGTISGGAGGGAIKLTLLDLLEINGTLTMSGTSGGSTETGGGAGGSIWITTYNQFIGSGSILAKGGNAVSNAGSGGGGRISLVSLENEFSGTIDYSAGDQVNNVAYKGANGSFSLSGLPAPATNLEQIENSSQESLEVGATLRTNEVKLSAEVSDPDSADELYAEFELKEIDENFQDEGTHTSDIVQYVDTPLEVSISTEVDDLRNYHWQVRVCNSSNFCSQWTSFGNNEESEADFSVALNATPNNPTIPGSSTFIDGQRTNDTTPTFFFSQTDPDSGNQVRYLIQVDTTSDFSSPSVVYTGGLTAQGTASFSVGQNAGSGSYSSGTSGQTLSEGSYYWRIKTIDEGNSESDWVLAPGTPSFVVDTTAPSNSITTRMKAYAAHETTYSDDSQVVWFSRSDMFFSWTTSGDTSGLKGYCVYLGTDPDGDPSSQKGLLGSSPVSTTGSNCQFIIDDTEIDFSNAALRGSTWLSSSSAPYYFKIRPIDTANNSGQNDTDSSTFSFFFDSTAPNNVSTISASSGSLSSISDMQFYWPISGAQAATDAGSGILGYQYAINSTGTWRGALTDATTGHEYIATNSAQPFSLDANVVGEDIIIGSNVLYFRTVDVAGNASTYTTAALEYGGEAPSFDNPDVVTVTPTTNTENTYAFSWPAATPSDGRTISTYYYMINTAPPALYQTITSNSATYIPTTATSIAATSLSNIRKGSNTIYVVAVDDNGNYSQSNYIYGNFTLNSTLPDPPQSLVVSDASVKASSLWRASLAWSAPDYKGTGDLNYEIERSNDAETWSSIDTTNGLAFLDTLSASSKYYWRVAATDSSDESAANPSYSNAVSLTPKGAFTEPAALTSEPAASSITTKRATVSWTTARASDSKIALGTKSGDYEDEETSNSTQVSEHKINLINLQPGTTYYYVAKWTDEDGNTGESDEKTFKTDPAPLVQDVVVKNIGVDSALVEFTTIGASSANINYGKSTSFGGIETIATSTLETTYAVQLSDLEDGTKYYFKIDTKDAENDIYDGTILNFETLPKPEVSNVRVQQVANTAQSSILVTWESNTAISSIVTFYPESNPEYARDAVDIKLFDGEHEMIIPGLLPETSYILIVKGRDRIGNEAVSDTLRFTTATDTRPPKISDLVVEGTNVPQVTSANQEANSQLVVTWTTDEPATSQVEYGDGTGATYSQVTQEDQTLTYNHLVIISGLSPSKVYHLRSISRDSAANESKSVDTVTITPRATDNAFDLVITNLREVFGFLGTI